MQAMKMMQMQQMQKMLPQPTRNQNYNGTTPIMMTGNPQTPSHLTPTTMLHNGQ